MRKGESYSPEGARRAYPHEAGHKALKSLIAEEVLPEGTGRNWVNDQPDTTKGALVNGGKTYELTFSGYVGAERTDSLRQEIEVVEGVAMTVGNNSFIIFKIKVDVRDVPDSELSELLKRKIWNALIKLWNGEILIKVKEKGFLGLPRMVEKKAQNRDNIFYLYEILEIVLNVAELSEGFLRDTFENY